MNSTGFSISSCVNERLWRVLVQETGVIDWNSSTVIEGITRGMLDQTAVILFWTGSIPYKYLLYWKTDSYCSSDLEKILKNDWDFPCETNIKSCNWIYSWSNTAQNLGSIFIQARHPVWHCIINVSGHCDFRLRRYFRAPPYCSQILPSLRPMPDKNGQPFL